MMRKKQFWVTFTVSGDVSYLVEAETGEEAQEKAQGAFVAGMSPDSFTLCRESDFEVEKEGDEEAR